MGQNYSDRAAKAAVGFSAGGEWKKRLRVRRRRRREDKSPAEELACPEKGRRQPPNRRKQKLSLQQPELEGKPSASLIQERSDAGSSAAPSTVQSVTGNRLRGSAAQSISADCGSLDLGPLSADQGTAPGTPDMRLDGQGGRLRRDMSKCNAAKPGPATAKERSWLEDGKKTVLGSPADGFRISEGTERTLEGTGRTDATGGQGLDTLDHVDGNCRENGVHHPIEGEQTSRRPLCEATTTQSGGVLSHVTISVVPPDGNMGSNHHPHRCPIEELWTTDSGIGGPKLTITPPDTDCPPKTAQSGDSLLNRRGPPFILNSDTHSYAIPRLIVTRDVSPKRCLPPSLSPQFLETGFSLDVPLSGEAESPCSDSGCGGSPVPSLFLRKLSSSSGLSSASSFEESEDDFIGSDLEPSGSMVCGAEEHGASVSSERRFYGGDIDYLWLFSSFSTTTPSMP
ncbi:uncharacterized protein ACNLHF_000011 [Anomaloglossus baeobatrachus]|uniref:uncharacterized protein LOC142251803 n=1 Tax=Anomaloglossus baeobatrachus TaxID=238106 RepID=UPI003F4FFD2E